jgi:hypothetical protein
MIKSLYEISTEALEIANALEEGELTEELENRLIINQSELQTKAVNYAFVIKDSKFTISAIDEEIKRLHTIKEMEENKQKRLIQAISDAMNLYGLEKVETPVMTLSFRASESIEIINMDQLSNDYKVTKTSTSADKKAIKDAIKEGKDVDGAILNKNRNLQIK